MVSECYSCVVEMFSSSKVDFFVEIAEKLGVGMIQPRKIILSWVVSCCI